MVPRNRPQPVRATPAATPATETAPPNAPIQAQPEAPADDREAASIRAQQLRAGNRRNANERVARLDYPGRPGWHQCWINDTPGNIAKFKELGHDFRIDAVTKERITRVAGTADGGGGLQTYLMELPEELYQEDQKALESQMNEIANQIKRGAIEGEAKDLGLNGADER